MQAKFFLLILFIVSLLAINCSKSNDVVLGAYQSGVLIVNQGNFSSANGDVTYYNPLSETIDQNIFNKVNGSFAGSDVQSLTIDGSNGYLVTSGGNSIEVININTFKLSSTFTDPLLINPRYLTAVNGKAYVSAWGAYDASYNLTKSYLLVFDTKTQQLVDTIGTDPGSESVLYNGKYIFVSNNNFGGSSTVSVIDPSLDKQIKKITLSAGPAGMVLDANNKLWVIANGTYGGNDGALYRIDATSFLVEQTINLSANPGNSLVTSPDKKTLYYFISNSVYQIGIDATTAPAAVWINNSDFVALSSLGVDASGNVYVGDALDYSSPGKVYIYKTDGSLKTQITSGIDPTQFIFR